MYESYFTLNNCPFKMSPDPRSLMFTPSHREALAGLMYGILNGKGFITLIGDAGTGKTSLLRRVLQATDANKCFIASPNVPASEFTKLVMVGFQIDPIPNTKVEQLMQLEQYLKQSHRNGKLCVLVIDEAQQLSQELLEEIRLLTNIEDPDEKLLQVVLAGQSTLRDSLNRPDLRQLKQRIAVRLTLSPLSGPREVEEYMRHRWVLAGGAGAVPFSTEAIESIARYSSNIPRTVNVICDNALLLAYSQSTRLVTVQHVNEAAMELDLLDLPESVEPIDASAIVR